MINDDGGSVQPNLNRLPADTATQRAEKLETVIQADFLNKL